MKIRRLCPFCLNKMGTEGSRDNLSINMNTGYYKCYRCGSYGFVTESLAKKLDVEYKTFFKKSFKHRRILNEPTNLIPVSFSDMTHKKYSNYLLKRGVTSKIAKLFKIKVTLGYEPVLKAFDSFVFPVNDGLRTGYIIKSFNGFYRQSEDLDRDKTLYNGVVLKKASCVYVFEGVFDVINTFPKESVATFGKSISEGQIKRLEKFEGNVIFAYDGDAWRYSLSYAVALSMHKKRGKVGWVKLPPGRDPGNTDVSELRKDWL